MIELNLEMAERAVKAAQAKAKELETPMTVSVVDEAGHLVLCARGDGTRFVTPETSRAKATASVALGRPTKDMVEMYTRNPTFVGSLASLFPGQFLPSTGAMPVIKEGLLIGAVGCGGGTGEQDHQCAEAGAIAAVS